nr:hypothetical protein CFP56_52138 [Quercus suber]
MASLHGLRGITNSVQVQRHLIEAGWAFICHHSFGRGVQVHQNMEAGRDQVPRVCRISSSIPVLAASMLASVRYGVVAVIAINQTDVNSMGESGEEPSRTLV